MPKTSQSSHLFHTAQQIIPGGVNSPVRAFKSVDANPMFIKSASGAYLTDVDGNNYIDYVGSWGPMILGHAHPQVINAVKEAAEKGLSFGAPCEYEILLAQEICSRMPSIEKIRMVNSGTEATMTAIRLARGVTKREKIIKFEGCYHGHVDSLLVKAGSGSLTFSQPTSLGIPLGCANDTLVANFNDIASVTRLFEEVKDIACIIIEPISGNMNMILPDPVFLRQLKEVCAFYGTLLIFDEVMTGFRVGPEGAQGLYDIQPDITTLGKIIGGGMPVGAVGGKAEIMDHLSPMGSVYQAGTLSGNPVAMAAGLVTLQQLTQEKYDYLNTITNQLINGIQERAIAAKVPLVANYETGMFGLFFTELSKVNSYSDVMQSNVAYFKTFFNKMLANGIYLAPSAFEAGFISCAHTFEDIERTLEVVEKVFSI